MANAFLTCDNCGQTDDHPKHHYGSETYHHDCTPHRVIEDMTSVSVYQRLDDGSLSLVSRTPIDPEDYDEHTKRFLNARALAQEGTRGEDLRKHLRSLQPHDEVAPLAVSGLTPTEE